jgi:mannosylglycoprotein endo-beta-mannosidase
VNQGKKRNYISEELVQIESLEEAGTLNFEQLARKVWLLKEYLLLLDQEESYWVNRCHENWLLKGDNNTSYFHKIANGRKRKKIMSYP